MIHEWAKTCLAGQHNWSLSKNYFEPWGIDIYFNETNGENIIIYYVHCCKSQFHDDQMQIKKLAWRLPSGYNSL